MAWGASLATCRSGGARELPWWPEFTRRTLKTPPSIEKTYGRPIQEWLDPAADRLDTHKHMEVVEWLKTEHGLGHGHANAIVAYVSGVRRMMSEYVSRGGCRHGAIRAAPRRRPGRGTRRRG